MSLYPKLFLFVLTITISLAVERGQPETFNGSSSPLTRKPRYYFAMQEYLKPWNLTLESFFGRWKPVERRFEKPKLKLPVKMRPSTTTPKPQQRESPPVTNCTEPPKSLYYRLVRSSLAIVRYLQANIFVEMFLLSQGPEPHARWNNSFRRLASKLESWSPKSNCSQLIVNISVPQQ